MYVSPPNPSVRLEWLRSAPFEDGLSRVSSARMRRTSSTIVHHAYLAIYLPRALPAATNSSSRSTLHGRKTVGPPRG